MKGKKIAIAVIAIAAVVIATLFASGAVSTKGKGSEGAVKSTVTEQSVDHSLFYHTWQTDYSGVDDDFRQFYPSAVAFSETKATLEADKKDSSSYIIDGDKITITAGKEKIVYNFEINSAELKLTIVCVSDGEQTYNAEDFLPTGKTAPTAVYSIAKSLETSGESEFSKLFTQ